MKNPAKLLWMGLAWGILISLVLPLSAQEPGFAVKGTSVDITAITTNLPTRVSKPSHKRLQTKPRNLPVAKSSQSPLRAALASPQTISEFVEPQTLSEPSPSPAQSFLALPDDGQVAPPDTSGAVGPTHLVVACASELRISDRQGNPISTRSQEVFWAGVATNIFDTRVVYDPTGQRFIMTAAGDPGGSNPRLCIAVSASSNPTGTWYRWTEDVDAVNPVYADSPTLGFNKTWIVVQVNLFNKNTFQFFRSEVYAYNKANLYANGAGQRTKLAFSADMGGSQVPATTYDTNGVVYLVENWNGRYVPPEGGPATGFLRLFSITGGIGSERLNVTNSFGEAVFAEVGTTWAEIATNDMDILPQAGSTNKIYAGDSSIQNVHFRDGLLYVAHTVFLPSTAPTNAAVQWWAITAGNGEIIHFGRVRDSSGANMYAYPSIAANRYNDVMIGYSRFSAAEFPSAAYSFRTFDDPTDELRGEVVLKAGDAPYYVPVFDQNRWGDWSATTVDPVNDTDLWTIQEYAAPTNAITGGSRWGTWWGRIAPPSDLAITMTDAPDPVPAGNQITYSLLVTNKQEQIVSGVTFDDFLPNGVSYVSAVSSKGSCTYSAGVVHCAIGTLSDLEAATVTITVTAGLPGFATNVVTVSANGPDSNNTDNTAITSTEIIASSDLQVQGSDNPDPVHVGNPLTYTLTISNRGPSAAAGVVMTSTLPASVTIGSISASQGIWNVNANVITFTLGVVNNASTAVITIGCTPNAGGLITNQVRVTANTSDNNPANNTANVATRVNALPVITQLSTQTINEDVPTVIPVTISDAETAAGSLQFSATSSNPGLIPNANIVTGGTGQNRTLTITSAPNQFGSNTTITVTVTDGDGASSTMLFPLNVAAVNDAPTISSLPNTTIAEDTSTNLNFTISDIDSPVGSLTVSATSGNTTLLPPSNINLTGSGSSRTVSVTPAADRFGSGNITVTVSDGNLTSSTTFTLTVNPVNDPPTISSIAAQNTSEDVATAAIGFTVNDPETQPTNLTVTASSSDTTIVPNGNLALANLGNSRTIRVTPAANQNGFVTITVRVSDGTNSQTTAFDLTISGVNDPPTLAQPSNITTNEDAGVISVPLTGISSGAANENQTITIRASTSTPDRVENLQINYTSPNSFGTLSFTTVADAVGTALIDLVVSDGVSADDVTRQFQVVLNGVNDPPTIDPVSNIVVSEDSGPRTITLTGITSGPSNESAQTNLITASSSATAIVPHPQIVHVPGSSTAALTFTPAANASGTATITIVVNDLRPANSSTTNTFQITVDPVNDLPTISTIPAQRISEDTASGAIAFNFRDVEPGALTPTASSSDQSLVPDANLAITGTGTNRSLVVTPSPNQFGSANITVRVTDADGGSTTTTFLLTVDPINDPPTLAAIPNPPAIDEDASIQTVNISGITAGPSNESAQTVLISAISSNPSIVPHPTVNYTAPNVAGSLTYTPVANATGSVVITVTADDRQAANNLASQTFTVRINPVNDLPTIAGDFEDKFTDEDVPLVLSNIVISDIETAVGSLTLTASSSNPELVDESGITFSGSGANRTVTVRPLTNEFGSTFITITVSDGNGGTAEAGFVLIVNELDDAPLIAAPPAQTIAEDVATAPIPFWVTDIDTPVAGLSITARSSNTALVPDANLALGGSGTNRNIRATPLPDASGATTITLTVSDGTSSRSTQFNVNVSAVNDPPTLADIPALNILEDSGSQLITLAGVGPGAANETSDVLTISAVSSAPSLIPNSTGTNIGGVWKLPINPVANANGSANITVTVNDGRATNAIVSKTFTVNVQPVNDPPTLAPIAALNLNEDAPQQNITLTGISAGPGENEPLTFTVTSSNPGLAPTPTVFYTNGNSTAVLRFTVAPNAAGTSTINVRLSDGLLEVTQSFIVTVIPVNEPPAFVTTIPNLSTPEDTAVSAQFVIADEETYGARLTLSATSTNTTLVPNTNIVFHGSDSNRWITITPAANLSGNTRITVALSDGTNTASMSFNLSVTSVNDAPTLNPLPNIALTGNPANQTINLTGISAGGGESQVTSIRVASSNPSLVPVPSSVTYTSPNSTGSFVLNPANNLTGTSLITVTVWDNGSPSNSFSQNFTIYIRDAANALPTLTGLTGRTTPEDTPINIPIVVNDTVTPVADLILGAFASNSDLLPTNAFSFSGTTTNRTLTITPQANQSGSTTVTVWVLDGQNGYTGSNFVLQVTPVNDAPVISSIAPQSVTPGTNMAPVGFSISDAETPAQNLTVTASSSNQGLLPNANIALGGSGTNRSVTAYPVSGQTGSSTITITVTDASSVSASTAFVLTVRPPQPPALSILRAGTNVELRWPAEAGLYTIQSREHLTLGTWADIAATPSINGTNYIVPQPIAGTNKFFRLRN